MIGIPESQLALRGCNHEYLAEPYGSEFSSGKVAASGQGQSSVSGNSEGPGESPGATPSESQSGRAARLLDSDAAKSARPTSGSRGLAGGCQGGAPLGPSRRAQAKGGFEGGQGRLAVDGLRQGGRVKLRVLSVRQGRSAVRRTSLASVWQVHLFERAKNRDRAQNDRSGRETDRKCRVAA